MPPSNGNPEPDERTSLLSKDVPETIEPSLGDAITPGMDVNSSSSCSKGDDRDEERGEVEDGGEGNHKVAQKMYLLFPAVSIGILLSAADQTLVVSSYARMGSDLNALNNTSWIATAYFLTLTGFQPLYGKLSDIFGRKPALLFAYIVFGTGCLLCGLARNLGELVAARAFAGIGGGGVTTVVSILFSDIVPLRERGSWQGYMNIVYAVGASGGAPLGGFLADSIGWRWAFLGQFPMCFVATIAVYFVLDLPRTDHSHWLEKIKRVDFLGAFSLVFAVFSLLIGLDRGSNVSWSDTVAIVCSCVSIPLFAIFIFIEMKVASHPFAPGHIIFERSLLPAYLCNFFGIGAHMGMIFYIPLYFQAVEGMSATSAGLRLVPAMICSVSGSLFAGFYMQKTGHYFWLTVCSFAISIAGSVVVFLCSGILFTSGWAMVAGMGITAFGAGSVVVATLISVLANADPKDQAIATACSYLFRSLGSVTGVSLAATVVQQSLRTRLRASLKSGKEADEIVDHVRQNLDYIKKLEPQIRVLVRKCYQKATNSAFGISIAFIICALVSSLYIREKKLSR
ncbi:Vacuolar membrane amino acid uptake transporter [Lachnellula hyalina]|uniref:Vacuolar membrane amino acid uptake transporter n=1 Tax=Lachnellula hyalina TaxID=1316788 RepID=A0A8H8R3D1_9HELO|nr:Vacuolar membrane amino acid uptake transporter [Lachnellula hyalina]TVY27763.1 Vacuolar membrane amino acid uptake transporter [Lachnellula hyalina]